MKQRLHLSFRAWSRLAAKLESAGGKRFQRSELAYWFGGLGRSLLFRLQNASHAEALQKTNPFPPLFLLGFWRSGTTLLHELLSCDPKFGFPSTYACMRPSHFLLTEKWLLQGEPEETTRSMDNMKFSWKSPQEDEFALLALGAPSAYEALVVPSLMKDPKMLLDFRCRSDAEQARWGEAFRQFLTLLTLQQGKPLILKSPPHGFKLEVLLSRFPQSQFVIIERNPYEVFASNLKLWRSLLSLYALEAFSEEQIEDFVLSAYLLHEEAIASGLSSCNGRSVAMVRYEALTADSIGEMRGLYEKLALPGFDSVALGMQKYLDRNAGYVRNRFKLSLAQRRKVERVWGNAMAAKGYGWPEKYVSAS